MRPFGKDGGADHPSPGRGKGSKNTGQTFDTFKEPALDSPTHCRGPSAATGMNHDQRPAAGRPAPGLSERAEIYSCRTNQSAGTSAPLRSHFQTLHSWPGAASRPSGGQVSRVVGDQSGTRVACEKDVKRRHVCGGSCSYEMRTRHPTGQCCEEHAPFRPPRESRAPVRLAWQVGSLDISPAAHMFPPGPLSCRPLPSPVSRV